MPFPSLDQQFVIEHRGRPLVVVAGPGTGKTRTLVERMISLLRENSAREVTFITFTRASRRDTEARLRGALGDAALDEPHLMFPRTSTLHTYAKRLVHRFAHVVGRDNLFSMLIEESGERALVVREVADDLSLDISHSDLSDAIAEFRATFHWPASTALAQASRQATIARFADILRLYRTFDMEGLVLAASQVLSSPEGILPELFLQVDEYQDLDPADQRFVDLLAAHPASQVVIVGDDAQSIYGRRFANFQGLRGLWNNEAWETRRFATSHRLPAHVLNTALQLIANRGYLGSEIDPKPDDGRLIPLLQCTNADLQLEAVARDIEARRASSTEAGNPQLRYGDFLVLCPTRSQVNQGARSLIEFGIPAHSSSRSAITDAYWSVVLLLRIAHDADPLALRQCLPSIGLAEEEISSIRHRALDSGSSFLDACLSAHDPRILSFYQSIAGLRDASATPETLGAALAGFEGASLPTDFNAFLETITDDHGNLPSLGRVLQLIYERFGVLEPDDPDTDADSVLVTTLQGAKGLESEYVYCTWLNSTFMPLEGRDAEEERRVLYVAMTRAKRSVLLTFPERFDQTQHRVLGLEVLSPFLAEILGRLQLFRATAQVIRTTPVPWQ